MKKTMTTWTRRVTLGAIITMNLAIGAQAVEPPKVLPPSDIDQLVGKPIDLAPWAYAWRADRQVQEQAESAFIIRRLDRMDKVYRTLPQDMIAKLPKGEKIGGVVPTMPPSPAGKLHAARLWVGPVPDCQVELQWPAGQEAPPPEAVEVRAYPEYSNAGWFCYSMDQILPAPTLSADRRTWTYTKAPASMIAVFVDPTKTKTLPGIPEMRIVPPSLGTWQRMDVEIEWGFTAGTEAVEMDARLEISMGRAGAVTPLAGDTSTQLNGTQAWRSRGAASRRGITTSILQSGRGFPCQDTICTLRTATGGCSFRLADLSKGPIFVPAHGLFIAKAGSGVNARDFVAELAKKNVKGLRQLTREHPDAASLDDLLRHVRVQELKDVKEIPPLKKVDDVGSMRVEVPDSRWTDAWRAAAWQFGNSGGYIGLAHEGARIAHDMDLVGLHDASLKVLDYYLKSKGGKPDGDFVDGDGALEVSVLDHDMGWEHRGTHASSGRVLFALANRYFLTGDQVWLKQTLPRLQAAADWIIRQRDAYLKDLPNRKDLQVAGLQPPLTYSDSAMGICSWRWYYGNNGLELQGLHRFAQALATVDPVAGQRYLAEAERYRQDLRRALHEEAVRSPVRRVRDGTYRIFIPATAMTRGAMLIVEMNAPQYGFVDLGVGILSLAELHTVLAPDDVRLDDTLTVMEEMVIKEELYAQGDAWFWAFQGPGKKGGVLPKCTHTAGMYLLKDDAPNFLRWWGNTYASIVTPSGMMKEWPNLGSSKGTLDKGTSGWFLEHYRKMLMMEIEETLWIARATPRPWLEQGKNISVKNAPTYFGNLNYAITSDVTNGKINASVEIPSRTAPKEVILRFRHPTTAPIKSVTVNGKDWKDFNKDKETITLKDLTGTVAVTAQY